MNTCFEITPDFIDDFVEKANEVLVGSAKEVFLVYVNHSLWNNLTSKNHGLHARMNFRKTKRLFKRCGGGIFKENLYEKERLYKHKLKSARNCHTLDMRKKLQYLRTYNPKEYWKILNANCTHKECKVDLSNLYSFYENGVIQQ